ERVVALQVDVVVHHDQRTLLVVEVNSTGSFGEDQRAHAHAPEHAYRKRDILRRISFIKMDAPLHSGDWHPSRFPYDHVSRMPNGSGKGKRRNFGIGNSSRVRKFVGEAAEARPEHHANLWPERSFR